MAITLPEYKGLPVFQQRVAAIGDDYVEAYQIQLWGTRIDYGQPTPPVNTLTVDIAGASQDDVVLPVLADNATSTDFKVYRGDTIIFNAATTPVPVVVDADFTLVADNTTVNNLPVAPLLSDLTGNDPGDTYALLPMLSLEDGGVFDRTGTAAVVRNKPQGLHPARLMVSRDATMAGTGKLYRNDPLAFLLSDMMDEGRNLYVEVRYPVYAEFTDKDGNTVQYGSGPGAYSGSVTANSFSIGAPAGDVITTTFNFEQAAFLNRYKAVGLP